MEIKSIENSKSYTLRRLEESDYDKGYFDLLGLLTQVTKPDKEEFIKQINKIKETNIINIFVIEDKEKVIASITLIIEPKFIRNMRSVCHIEDFIIDSEYRKMKFGTSLCEFSKTFARENNCYKIILDCAESVSGFYIKQGFEKRSEGMSLYL